MIEESFKEHFYPEYQAYPEAILQYRLGAESTVAACLLNDLGLVDEYPLQEDFFISKNARFFFRLACELRKKGMDRIDYGSVKAAMSEDEYRIFQEAGGYNALQRSMNSVDVENFEGHLDHFYRELIICKAWEKRMFAVHSQIKFEGEMINVLEKLRKLSSEECLEFFEQLVSELDHFNLSSGIIDAQQIDFDEEWLNDIKQGVEDGVPYATAFFDVNEDLIKIYPRLSDQTKGLMPRTSTYIGGYSSTGKSTWWIGVIMSLLAQGHKVIFISNEENASRFKLKCLSWIIYNVLKVNTLPKGDIARKGNFTEEQDKIIDQAKEYWNENELDRSLRYIQIRDADMSNVRKLCRQAAADGYDVVIYDTFKMQISDMNHKRTDLDLVRDSRMLDELAKKYNLIMLCSIQLAENNKGKLWLDSSCLSNSKQIKEILENLFLMRNVYKDELDPSNEKKYIEPFRIEFDENHKKIRVPVPLDTEDTVWKVLFTEKSRSGANSEDTKRAILFRFDGDHSTFEEYCWCEPKHGMIT